MTAAARKRRYRTDPEFRAAVLESNRRSRARDTNPHRGRLNRLASDICRYREWVAYHMREAERLDKRLLELVQEREQLKQGALQ